MRFLASFEVTSRLALALMLAVFCAARPAWSQSGTAGIQGVVADQQGAAVPGATVTVTNAATSLQRNAVTNTTGYYQILAIPPGLYDLKVELSGFRTAVSNKLTLSVDTVTKLDVEMAVGQLSETVEVTGTASMINRTDASMGNVITGAQVRALPLEARNPVGLLSLQPGAMFVPSSAAGLVDPRNGAVSGARADQSNVTLDGVDVNDPQFSTAYSSAVRVTLDSLQEFRVSTSNYSAEMGRSGSAQVSLVTRSGTNSFHGSGSWANRDTRFSSNEYFQKMTQLRSGLPSKAPLLNKNVYGGALGGPIRKDKFFFFGNFEGLRQNSETPVSRSVPTASFRDGVLIYGCTVASACPASTVQGFTTAHSVPAGFYGLAGAQLAAIDPLGIGASRAASELFKKYPLPNDPGRDTYNIAGYRFSAPIQDEFLTYIGRLDYHINGSNNLFGRGNFQDDTLNSSPQFPGGPPRTARLVKNRGFAIGYDTVLSSTKVNTFRYGFTEIVDDTVGLLKAPTVSFRFIDDTEALTSTNGRKTPTHNFVEDLSMIAGNHTWKFGTNIRISRIPRYTNQNSFVSATANGSWNAGVGRRYMPGGACPGVTAGCSAVPAVSSGTQASYGDSFTALLGVINQANGAFNYDKTGKVLPIGEPARRKYGSDEFEFYAQDSWKLHPTFTVTAGVRYALYSPPYEVNGVQVAPSQSLGKLFDERAAAMKQGRVVNPAITLDLAGPANNKPGFYAWDKSNFAPRFAAAWAPRFDGGFMGWLSGKDKMVVRGGYSMVYDRVGHALATQFDAVGSFGLSTNLSSPFGLNTEATPGIRFVSLSTMPPQMPAAPKGGFPQSPPKRAAVITSSIDDTITTPYAHTFNVVVGRELRGNFGFEAAYVGRLGRDLLIRRDLAMPLDLHDPKSGMSYFQAAQQVIRATQAAGSPNGVGPIAYWENMFPGAAGGGRTATQAIAAAFAGNAPDYITALYEMDEFCDPACSIYGPFAFFMENYDSLAGVSSKGRSDYHAMQLTLRKRFSKGHQFDFNYTLSNSKDDGSAIERGSFFTAAGNGGYTGFWLNSWEPELHYGTSDFDARHNLNMNGILDLPFGRGRALGTNAPGWLNQIIGDWSLASVWRLSSGYPFNVQNCRSCWPTNWNLQGNAILKDGVAEPETALTKNAVGKNAAGNFGLPSPFVNPSEAINAFRRALPGEVGVRNIFRGDGYFTIDTSLSKAWNLPFAGHRLLFRWDTFNLTNTPKFDIFNVTMTPDIAASFGRYNGTLASCDGAAGRCMQFGVRYEF